MGQCACGKETIHPFYNEVMIPSTDETPPDTCQKKKKNRLYLQQAKTELVPHYNHLKVPPPKIRSFMKVPTNRFGLTKEKTISAEMLLAHTKTVNSKLDFYQSQEPNAPGASKIYYSPKKKLARGETAANRRLSISYIQNALQMQSDAQTKEKENEIVSTIENEEHFEVENVEVTNEQESKIFQMLRNHFMFRHFDDKMIQIIIENSQGFQIEENSYIFREGDIGESFFIIQNGQVKITSEQNKESRILGPGDGFGEMGLIYTEVKRNATAIALTKLDFYVIFGQSYRETSKNFSKHSIEQINYFLDGNIWLNNIPQAMRLNLASLASLENYEKNEYLYSNGSTENVEKIYLVKSGALEIIRETTSKMIYSKEYVGESQVIMGFKEEGEFDLVSAEESSAYIITRQMLIEVIGENYQEIIMFSVFKSAVSKNKFFRNILMECYFKSIFQLFKFKHYKSNDVVFQQGNSNDNKKALLILDGVLVDSEDKSIVSKKGELFGDEIINSSESLENSLIAGEDTLLVLECSWISIRDKLKELSKNSSLDIFKRVNKLSKMYIFKHISESRILELCQLMKKVKYSKNDIIIRENENVTNFYVIIKGRVQVSSKGSLVREMDDGSCFGEFYLLNDEKSDVSFTALDEVQCYSLPKETFMNFLIDENMNDYIKKKMCLEDTNVELDDLYHLAFLGKGRFGTVSLVHNGISLYAIKTVPKGYIESNIKLSKYMLSEKKILLSLDYPLIVKLVKTLKYNNLCFFLMEYISGKSVEDFISSKVMHCSIQGTKFFTGCLALILDYLNRKSITHRDIKPANLIIDNTGYIKILDFGTAKKIRDFTFTVLGTPNCMAPEIMLGKGYSFPVDYWSIGVCVYYFYYGKYPFGGGGNDVMTIYDEIINKDLSFPSVDSYSGELNSFLGSMMNKNPINRLCSLQKIEEEPFFKGFDWKELKEFKMKPPYIPNQNELKDSANSLMNTKAPFLSVIMKYKFEGYPKAEESSDATYQSNRDYTRWLDEF